MKLYHSVILSVAAIIQIGCNGGDSSSATSSNSTSQNVTPTYNYLEDGTGVRELNNESVNSFETLQQTLATLKEDKQAFIAYLDKYVLEVLSSTNSVDSLPSYAPRGNNSSQLYSVKNGTLDYSSYRLNGDVNGDYKVDFSDVSLIEDALFSEDNSYDSNGDGIIDVKDLIYTLARLNTEIYYFDFYTKDKQKLSIDTRSISDEKSFSYDGNASEILVVAKDENMASGFSEGLSDSDNEWYHKKGWVADEAIEVISQSPKRQVRGTSSNDLMRDTIRNVTKIEPDPYLTGWHFLVSYVDTGRVDDLVPTTVDSFIIFLDEAKGRIHAHFLKSNMVL